MKNLFDQLTVQEIAVVGLLVGVDTPGPSFRNYLREVDALAEGWTLGDAAQAYLTKRAERLSVAL